MFTRLVESMPHRQPNRGGAIVSALFHSVLIVGAVYATASGAASKVVASAASQMTKVTFVQPSAQPASAPAQPAKPKPKPIVAPTKIATETPPIDPNAQPTAELETGPTTNALPGGGVPGAYNAFEVEQEVVAIIGTIRPQYPDALRSSGVEGTVNAEFIVNEKGRAERESLKILSTTHRLFADAVTRALPQMRFKPARIGGKPVSQLVQQQFVFRMDR
jgi:protein TonB